MSRYNSNVSINPYKRSSIDKNKIKQTIILQKRRHHIFQNSSKSQMNSKKQ